MPKLVRATKSGEWTYFNFTNKGTNVQGAMRERKVPKKAPEREVFILDKKTGKGSWVNVKNIKNKRKTRVKVILFSAKKEKPKRMSIAQIIEKNLDAPKRRKSYGKKRGKRAKKEVATIPGFIQGITQGITNKVEELVKTGEKIFKDTFK